MASLIRLVRMIGNLSQPNRMPQANKESVPAAAKLDNRWLGVHCTEKTIIFGKERHAAHPQGNPKGGNEKEGFKQVPSAAFLWVDRYLLSAGFTVFVHVINEFFGQRSWVLCGHFDRSTSDSSRFHPKNAELIG